MEDLLRCLPCLFVHDCFMRTRKYKLLFCRNAYPLASVFRNTGFEVYGITHVFPSLNQFGQHSCIPIVWLAIRVLFADSIRRVLETIVSRCHAFFLYQCSAYTLAPEVHLGVETSLDVVAPDAAQIFGDHHTDQACINVCNELLPSSAFEVAAAEAIICVVPAMGETVVCRIRSQV